MPCWHCYANDTQKTLLHSGNLGMHLLSQVVWIGFAGSTAIVVTILVWARRKKLLTSIIRDFCWCIRRPYFFAVDHIPNVMTDELNSRLALPC